MKSYILEVAPSKICSQVLINSNLHYTRNITSQRAKSGGPHLRSLAPGQHRFEVKSQRWRAVGETASDLTGPGIEPTPRAMSLTNTLTGCCLDLVQYFAMITPYTSRQKVKETNQTDRERNTLQKIATVYLGVRPPKPNTMKMQVLI